MALFPDDDRVQLRIPPPHAILHRRRCRLTGKHHEVLVAAEDQAQG